MRIISGTLKGKPIAFIKSAITRPLKDSVKENIFNIIAHSNLLDINLNKSNILDLYSGVGSFGLECVSRGSDKVIFLPDQYMAKYVQTKTKVQIISWVGTCIVHERFSAQEIEDIKKQNPGIFILTHPECPPEVIAASDFTGSTSGMSNYVKKNQPKKVM